MLNRILTIRVYRARFLTTSTFRRTSNTIVFRYVNPSHDVVIVRQGWSAGDLRSSQWISLFRRLAELAGAQERNTP